MGFSVVFLALLALGAAVPQLPKQHAADQGLLQKQQEIIYLLDNLIGEIPNEHFRAIGHTYDIEANLQAYENPNLVKYFATAVKTGNVQPKGTVFSVAVNQLRQEFVLLTRIFLGAKDYSTFLNTAAWARVHLNEGQFVKAFILAVLQRPDLEGVILPPTYEILPHYYFDSRVIQEVHNIKSKGFKATTGEQVFYVPINFTSHLPAGEHKIAYFTEDIGLNNYYEYLQHAAYMLPELYHSHKTSSGVFGPHFYENDDHIGYGARWYYLHQQLLAHYNLERLTNGLGPIEDLEYNHLEIPFKPHLSFLNGLEFSGRSNGPIDVTTIRQNLYNYVRTLEKRVFDAIDSGLVITPSGAFLSLYQPQGYNILGDLIQGTGRSVNPRYYGSLVEASKFLLGGTPEFSNIWEYTPAAMDISCTTLRDPAFYVLFKRILGLYKHYQESLPAYQYNDVVLQGVQVQKIDISQLVTYFQDYIVNLDNAGVEGVFEKEQKETVHGGMDIKGLLKRLDHHPYEYQIYVQSQKAISNAVVRVYLGPKFDHEGLPIDINTNRMDFVELDQFFYDLVEGQNVITRNSHQSSIHSADVPSVDEILHHVESAAHAQSPHFVFEPQQVYGFPSRLSLPKGTYGGFPFQLLVVVSAGKQPLHYGPIIPDYVNSYHSHSYQPVSAVEYETVVQQPAKAGEGYTMVEVVPDVQELGVGSNQGKFHWTDLYNKYHGYYAQPQWQYRHSEHPGYQYATVSGQHGLAGQGIIGEHGFGVSPVQGVHHGPGFHQEQGVQHGVSEGLGAGYESGKYQSIYQSHIHSGSGVGGVVGGQTYGEGVYGQKQVVYGQGQGVYGHGKGVYGQGQGVYGQGFYGQGYGKQQGVYSGAYPSGVYGYVSGIQTQAPHDELLQKYHQGLHISELIGGAISLDGKPLGWPLDRQLGVSVWNAPNIFVSDVYIYHHDVPVTHVVESH
ncbi:hexamerin-like [Belonocnema kinseyi]|uniref:hexamerin-like n=1 Tax=Belonocnema kinseyi TaxID=2817044 RepID=UPI00143DD83A|nr:hexamerin-like [Belonocnema kinseyi]